jgi:hypothetical protein
LVANGYHSATSCAACGEMLVDYELSKDDTQAAPASPILGAGPDKNGTSSP